MAQGEPRRSDCVFINCPFDEQYWPLFEAIVFCVIDCGFVPRCSLERSNAGEDRLSKISRLIKRADYGIHDLSRVELSKGLPRFNMPFELGLDLGAQTYGLPTLRRKQLLVLDSERYRYQAAISDLAGRDISSHDNSPDKAITVVRHWLRTASGRMSLPSATEIKRRFLAFAEALPDLCDPSGVDREDLQFVEYVKLAELWLTQNPRSPQVRST